MEVATTNNHSQSHHHHNHHHHLQPTAVVGGAGGSRSPFQREVREWQRIDPNTGALFSGRLEADRWINGPLNSYGKKSSSSISSQSSNNSNLTTAAQAASNTHRSAGKISLHAIVGPESSSSSSSSPASSAVWAKQADLYGQLPSGVGGSGGAGGADVAVAPPTQRRDLESFRHYNDDDGDDDDLRLTARHQRRQQVSQSVYAPPLPSIGSTLLQRSRSISTDDLSNDWEREDPAEQPVGEWRRVSKLRRSFQSQDHYKSPASSVRPRPLDLPSNSVSVARLRAELENGRRLHTAMRNNHVDLAALDNILNTPSTKPTVAKRNTFLTAESLQEIRGKLKKLSDESLYKEDFLAYHQKKPVVVREISVEKIDPTPPTQSTPSAFRPVHNTHSLESRQRQKDTSSSEWHLRRKSYGFEKMSPPEDKSIFRVDASTDSGLGRSGEQLGNWSPTERERERNEKNAAAAQQQNGVGTIVHFDRSGKPHMPSSSPTEGELSKRHSIAVEETWRDVRKTSQVHVNGGTAVASTSSSHTTTTSSHLGKGSAQKRVEFCKTEVHFAAESGRVNIVETDGKPPPTQNFRRRRRSNTTTTTTTTSGPLQSLVKSASVVGGGGSSSSSTSSSSTPSSEVTHFGDDSQRRKTIATSTVAYRATLMDPPEVVSQPISNSSSSSQVTVTTVAKPVHEPRWSLMESTSRNSYTSTSGVDTTDNETDELSNIRGILKNKPVKPKPYHLGENIESADVLWSVPAMKADRDSPSARDSGITSDSPISPKSVAERIRIVEQRQQQQQSSPAGNGYSTKINVSLGSEDWVESGTAMHHHASSKYRQHRRPSAQELLLEDLRQHQRILDEGLKSTSLIMRTMRSASEFDEAMRRLSIASIESALVQPTIVVPTPMLRSHSYQEEGSYSSSRRPSTISTTSITSSDLFGSALYDSLPRTPLAPPRLKLLGNTQIPVSQQLTQLRRLYDAAEQDQEDSADEEVKRYFRDSNSDSGGGTQASSSPDQQPTETFRGSEYSSSWSRLKAKRTIWKIEAQDQMLKRADLPKSNVMNIALHAPQIEKPKATPPTLRIGQLIPVAKPRTLFIQPQIQAQSIVDNADESGSESLKIVKEARGARKLREHELSYFGVQQKQQQQTKLSTTTTTNPRRTLPSRSKVSHNDELKANTTTTTKWQLLNDRPDLLRHSSPQHNDNDYNHDDDDDLDEDEEHCYENIATELTTTFTVKSPVHSPERSRSPGSYERKADLQRDAQILSEMTRNADQTLKALSEEAAIKDQRRRSCSLQRRSAKPLETIDEKVKVYPQSMGVARGTFASEARRNSRQSTPSPTRARSSSQSSIECCPRDRSRSSSRESMTHGGGSSDDQVATKQRAERLRLRTPKREKSRHEPIEVRVHRTSSKPRSSSSATGAGSSSLESKRSSHHSRHSREVDQSAESKTSSSSRLIRSSRVADESRSRPSSHRDREKERDRERSRGSEKHRDELTRSRGHSSRSRHSEHPSSGTRESSRPSKTRSSRSSHDSATIHKKSTTSTTASSKASKTTVHKPSASATASASASTTTAPPTHHHELTHGKSTLNGHQHHQHHQHQHSSSGKHQGSGHGHREQQPHHVHSLTTSTMASGRHPRDRHGKDRK
ncbi:pneumococcal serine-rich repeat protein isoform X7 [Drosophila santomea]|uniref:pneumococcal serine-rich repeat protein isoform X7 n=1 Tax=Drosophila santomea TaxID=129105 RepID=UPI0019546DEB|nr:pneumococcal serine-rich repeat protein isoform X7 [Drosophila santomea]